MGARIASFFAEAAALGGIRAKVRLAELSKVPTALAAVVEDTDERVAAVRDALAKLTAEYRRTGSNLQDLRISNAVLEGSPVHRNKALALLAERRDFIHDLRLASSRITEAAATTLRIARAGVWLLDEAASGIRCEDLYELVGRKHSSGTFLKESDFPPYFAALRTETILDAHDAQNDPRTSCFTSSYLRPLAISAMMDIPIWSRGRLEGVLCCEHVASSPRRWTEQEQGFGMVLTQILSTHWSQ